MAEQKSKQDKSQQHDSDPMFALRGEPRSTEMLGLVGKQIEKIPSIRKALDTDHGQYLTASGTLTQFNAIMAAVQTTALSAGSTVSLKTLIGATLLMHVLAAFILCWAARPRINPTWTRAPPLNIPANLQTRAAKGDTTAMGEIIRMIDVNMLSHDAEQERALVLDTALNYRRGWRATMLAMVLSVFSLGAFLLEGAGVDWFSLLSQAWQALRTR